MALKSENVSNKTYWIHWYCHNNELQHINDRLQAFIYLFINYYLFISYIFNYWHLINTVIVKYSYTMLLTWPKLLAEYKNPLKLLTVIISMIMNSNLAWNLWCHLQFTLCNKFKVATCCINDSTVYIKLLILQITKQLNSMVRTKNQVSDQLRKSNTNVNINHKF